MNNMCGAACERVGGTANQSGERRISPRYPTELVSSCPRTPFMKGV